MQEAQNLETVFRNHFKWNLSRIKFLSEFIFAIIKVRTVNLSEIATAFSGRAKLMSRYKRLQRFFRYFSYDFIDIGKLIIEMLPIKNRVFTLSLDRTNWRFGRLEINILVLGIVYRNVGFPIGWICLKKPGNSNTSERIDIIKNFIEHFGIAIIGCITCDREFIGRQWFEYLLSRGLHFSIRIRENMLIKNSRGALSPAKNLFRNLRVGSYRILKGKRLVSGVKVFVVGVKLKEEYLILVTDAAPELAIEEYKKRWGIETLFGCLKKRGFNFETTHLNKLERIEKLTGILAITFSFCHIIGEWVNEVKEIKVKKHGRKAVSLFRYGLDYIREILLNISDVVNRKKLKLAIILIDSKLNSHSLHCNTKFLSCT